VIYTAPLVDPEVALILIGLLFVLRKRRQRFFLVMGDLNAKEVIYRTAPISTVFEVVGKANSIWMAAILFGLSHNIGGSPSDILGFLITAFLGRFFGKCMLDSKGFFWRWLFHTLQDILPFTLIALSGIDPICQPNDNNYQILTVQTESK